MRDVLRSASVLTVLGCLSLSAAAQAADCSEAGVQGLKIPGVTIASAAAKPASDATPAYCEIQGALATSGEGAPDGSARFVLKLPAEWNGKFLFWGVGGLAGGLYPSATKADVAAATAKGYATAVTDTGHQAGQTDASWALSAPGVADDAKLADYYFRAVHQVTVTAKALVTGYFGKLLARSYFDGCSNGGRQALMEASRYPGDYDGIVAGAPFMDIKAILAGARNYQRLLTPPAYLPAALLPVVDRAVIAACDAADGVKDGLIQNPAKCAFDPGTLVCKPGQTGDCLSAEQAAGLKTNLGATRDAAGRFVYPGGAFTDLKGGMDVWTVGATPPDDLAANEPWGDLKQGHSPLAWQFSDQVLKYIIERDPNFDLRKFKLDAASVDLFTQRTGAGNADVPGRLSKYIASGNKLLIYHGFSDPALPPFRSIQFYEQLAAATPGGYGKVQQNVRLFMVPGMQHCASGSGPNVFDTLSALEDWVEHGKPPEAIPARHFTGNDPKQPVDRTMPLCPFPAAARYKLQGDVNDGASWACTANRDLLDVGPIGVTAGLTAEK